MIIIIIILCQADLQLLNIKKLPQNTLIGEKEKRENVRNVFCAVNGEAFGGRSVLIVDDVITTGSTLRECCGMLSKYTSLIRCTTVCSTVPS